MNYTVRPAKLSDLGRIEEIYSYARDFMEKTEIRISGAKPIRPRRSFGRTLRKTGCLSYLTGRAYTVFSSSG